MAILWAIFEYILWTTIEVFAVFLFADLIWNKWENSWFNKNRVPKAHPPK